MKQDPGSDRRFAIGLQCPLEQQAGFIGFRSTAIFLQLLARQFGTGPQFHLRGRGRYCLILGGGVAGRHCGSPDASGLVDGFLGIPTGRNINLDFTGNCIVLAVRSTLVLEDCSAYPEPGGGRQMRLLMLPHFLVCHPQLVDLLLRCHIGAIGTSLSRHAPIPTLPVSQRVSKRGRTANRADHPMSDISLRK